MKKLTMLVFVVLLVLVNVTLAGIDAVPAMATSTIQYSPGGAFAGGWSYDGAGTISFSQDIAVDLVNGAAADGLVGATVFIPDLTVGGIPDPPYTLTGGAFSIMDSTATTLWMTAALGTADLVTIGTTGMGYTLAQIDLTGVSVTAAGALASAELASWAANSITSADLDISLNGANGSPLRTFADMLETGTPDGNGFSGSITAPEPCSLVLLSLGGLMLRRRKK